MPAGRMRLLSPGLSGFEPLQETGGTLLLFDANEKLKIRSELGSHIGASIRWGGGSVSAAPLTKEAL